MNNKIDMVYLWVDGNDPEFIKRKNQFQSNKDVTKATKITGDVRFWDNEELKYSLRSLEKYAPWINHVYIVTDRQVPKWLNTAYDKVTVIDHSQIMPHECIPCFNSNVIEYFLPYVPNLSEIFLYGNDDMFFCAPVRQEDFIKDDKLILRLIPLAKMSILKRKVRTFLANLGISRYKDYTTPVFTAMSLLEKHYGKVDYYSIHHNIDVYSKSSYLSTIEKFYKTFDETNKYRFRNKKCVHRIIFALDALYSGKAIMKEVPIFDGVGEFLEIFKKTQMFSYFDNENHIERIKRTMKRSNPKLFCINAASKGNEEIKAKSKAFLEELFPNPSKFEK